MEATTDMSNGPTEDEGTRIRTIVKYITYHCHNIVIISYTVLEGPRMADMSQAAQECIDDYFKREAGGMGLLASTQPSSSSSLSSLASAQPSGAYSTFCNVWRKFLGHVVVSKPMTDLCETCQRNSASIVRPMNLSEEEKSQVHVHVYIIMTH